MKKKIALLLSGIILLACIGGVAYAAAQKAAYVEKVNTSKALMQTASAQEETKNIAVLLSDEELKARILNEADGFDLRALLENKGYYADDIEIAIQKFIDASVSYHMTESELAYILSLVELDYDFEKLIDIYCFLQLTDDGIDMMKSIYDFANGQFESKYWIQNSYSILKHTEKDALTMSEITEYISQGLTLDEILFVYQMGLQMNMTEREMLAARLSGKGWNEIAALAYDDTALSSLIPADEELEQINTFASYARVLGQKPSEILEQGEQGLSVKTESVETINAKREQIFDLTSQMCNDDTAILESAKQEVPQLSEETISNLLEEGYRIRNIKEAASGQANSTESEEVLQILEAEEFGGEQ